MGDTQLRNEYPLLSKKFLTETISISKFFFIIDNPILCDDELPEIMSAMEVNHTRISGSTNCEEFHKFVVEENVPELIVNINSLPPALINEITPKPVFPAPYIDNSANHIPLAVTESSMEVKVVPLQDSSPVEHQKGEEKTNNLIIDKSVDLEMVLK